MLYSAFKFCVWPKLGFNRALNVVGFNQVIVDKARPFLK
jgi:hypothetical protein